MDYIIIIILNQILAPTTIHTTGSKIGYRMGLNGSSYDFIASQAKSSYFLEIYHTWNKICKTQQKVTGRRLIKMK